MRSTLRSASLALLGVTVALSANAAEPVSAASDLQSPSDVSTRGSAYSLPGGTWAFDLGALGAGAGDAFAKLGVAYGFGAGVQLELNVAHASVGLLNATARWHFIDTRYFDLGARVGFWYGRGQWFWILSGVTKDLVSKVDVINVPVSLTASTQLSRFVELDLGVEYSYSTLLGSLGNEDSIFVDMQLGMSRLALNPVLRFFPTDSTAIELGAALPIFTTIPRERGDIDRPFSETWAAEIGLRSRFARGLFGSLRFHYGKTGEELYGARLYPSFDVEYRL